MIRTKTAIVVGAGAAVEIELPGHAELLNRIAQGFDFQRLGTDLETAEMGDFDTLFSKLKGEGDALREAAQRIRAGSRMASTIHALLQQQGDDKHVLAAGKLAIAYYTLQAERQSAMTAEPRDPGDMPFRGVENWLFQLGHMIVNGVPRAKAEHCFDNLHIIDFNTGRAIRHFMPWVLHSGFGMPVTEAQDLCSERLKIVHPYGRAGQLEWEGGSEAKAPWGADDKKTLFSVAEGIRTASDFIEDRNAKTMIASGLTNARRLVFIGFDFNSLDTSLLFQERLTHGPETLVSISEGEQDRAETIRRVLKGQAGIGTESLAAMHVGPSWQMLSTNGLSIES